MTAHDILPAALVDQAEKRLALDRVADDFLQLLCRPDILSKRSDVEVTDKDRSLWRVRGEMRRHLRHEIQLVAEFGIFVRSGTSPPAGT